MLLAILFVTHLMWALLGFALGIFVTNRVWRSPERLEERVRAWQKLQDSIAIPGSRPSSSEPASSE